MKLAAKNLNILIATIAAIFLAILTIPIVAGAATITSGSLLLSDPRPSQTSTYTFSGGNFTTATTIRCAEIVFSVNADGTGGVPTGMTTTSTFDSTTLLTFGSWTVANPSAGTVQITNAGGETPAGSGNIVWGGITNSSSESTYYGTFTTYTDASCTGGNEVDSTVAAFVIVDGELVQLTIDPTLTFSVGTVGSVEAVNGVNTTVASTAGTIDFGNSVTDVANGISAHDVAIGTNAPNGYTVYIRNTGQLTNGASDTIDYLAGATNAAPTSFSAAGTEAWGYTTEDFDLAGGTNNRFQGGNWAAFTTTNAPVMDNAAAPSSTETIRVGHQVGVATTTEAGTYQTTIIYTAASVY